MRDIPFAEAHPPQRRSIFSRLRERFLAGHEDTRAGHCNHPEAGGMPSHSCVTYLTLPFEDVRQHQTIVQGYKDF